MTIKSYKSAIYAIHPIMYQTPIFRELETYINKTNACLNNTVLFGDDLSLKNTYSKEFKTSFSYGKWLVKGYNYKFLKNYTIDARSGFLSRVNPGIYLELKKEQYDVILIHGYESLTAWLTLFSSKLTGTKIVWRGESVLKGIENKKSFKQIAKKFILTRFFRSCDAVLYSCSGNKDFIKFYKVNGEKLFFIPCAVNNKFFQAEREKNINNITDIKKELGIDRSNMVILFSARFTTRKRPFDLLNAMIKICNSNITIIFVGDGIERKRMEDFVDKNNLNAIFTGFKSQLEISKFYVISDINIIISDYDPSPKAMNEAMNFRLPIIVSNVVGTAYDLVKEGENGFITQVGDINAIAQKIDYFNKNRDSIKKMGKKSFDIIQNWNYQENVKGILNAFEYVKE